MLSLRAGSNAVVVVPECGAGVAGWRLGAVPILRRALPAALIGGNPHAMGWFPLVPYGNRIGRGRFVWDGQEHVLTRNFGDSPHSIHGIGWQRPWQVESTSANSVTLSLTHQPDPSWPFAFSSVVGYRLTASSLTVTMAMTNRHVSPAPAGLGLHPFFPKLYDPALRFEASGAWDNGPDALPLRHVAVPVSWDHAEARPVALSRLDNCFTGWNRLAEITAGPASLRIEASSVFGNVQVFTPSWADFFCVEPVTHIPDAINRQDPPAGQGMHVLEPAETLSGTIALELVGAVG